MEYAVLHYGGSEFRLDLASVNKLQVQLSMALMRGNPQVILAKLANGQSLSFLVGPALPVAIEYPVDYEPAKPEEDAAAGGE